MLPTAQQTMDENGRPTRLPFSPHETTGPQRAVAREAVAMGEGRAEAAMGAATEAGARAAARVAAVPAVACCDVVTRDANGKVSFRCRFPGCEKTYASRDAVRKHCKTSHLQWLRSCEFEHSALSDDTAAPRGSLPLAVARSALPTAPPLASGLGERVRKSTAPYNAGPAPPQRERAMERALAESVATAHAAAVSAAAAAPTAPAAPAAPGAAANRGMAERAEAGEAEEAAEAARAAEEAGEEAEEQAEGVEAGQAAEEQAAASRTSSGTAAVVLLEGVAVDHAEAEAEAEANEAEQVDEEVEEEAEAGAGARAAEEAEAAEETEAAEADAVLEPPMAQADGVTNSGAQPARRAAQQSGAARKRPRAGEVPPPVDDAQRDVAAPVGKAAKKKAKKKAKKAAATKAAGAKGKVTTSRAASDEAAAGDCRDTTPLVSRADAHAAAQLEAAQGDAQAAPDETMDEAADARGLDCTASISPNLAGSISPDLNLVAQLAEDGPSATDDAVLDGSGSEAVTELREEEEAEEAEVEEKE
eukprot:scaffold87169_cov36-Phaeocystis_antarctica.AAC.1